MTARPSSSTGMPPRLAYARGSMATVCRSASTPRRWANKRKVASYHGRASPRSRRSITASFAVRTAFTAVVMSSPRSMGLPSASQTTAPSARRPSGRVIEVSRTPSGVEARNSMSRSGRSASRASAKPCPPRPVWARSEAPPSARISALHCKPRTRPPVRSATTMPCTRCPVWTNRSGTWSLRRTTP